MTILKPKNSQEFQNEMENTDPVKLLDMASHNGYLKGIKKAISKLRENWNGNHEFNWKADEALEVAAERGYIDIIDFILNDSSAHYNTSSYRQAAHRAINNGNKEIFYKLKENAKNKIGKDIDPSNPRNVKNLNT